MSLLIFPMSLLVFRKRAIGKNVGGCRNDGFYVLRGRKWRFFADGRGDRRRERDGGRDVGRLKCGASGFYKLSQESRVAKRSRGRWLSRPPRSVKQRENGKISWQKLSGRDAHFFFLTTNFTNNTNLGGLRMAARCSTNQTNLIGGDAHYFS